MGLDVMAKGDHPRLEAVHERRGRGRGFGIPHTVDHDENE